MMNFEKFCITFYGCKPSNMIPAEKEVAYEEFMLYCSIDPSEIYG